MTRTPSGPLGRDSMKFSDKMARYHGEIERVIYAAEILCPHKGKLGAIQKCRENCTFRTNWCTLYTMRKTVGDHVPQHDIPQVEVTK